MVSLSWARTTRPHGRGSVVGPARFNLSRCGRLAKDGTGHRWRRGVGAGGAAGIRTPDLRRARAALSRLSYGPRTSRQSAVVRRRFRRTVRLSGCRPSVRRPVGAPGLEPGTSALSGPRSDRLSYAPRRPPAARHHAVPSVAVAHPIGDPRPKTERVRSVAKNRSMLGARRQHPEGTRPPRARSSPGLPRRTAPPPTPRPPFTRGEESGARCPSRRLRRPGA